MMLSEQILEAVLGTRPFRFFSQVGSTNDIARDWALEGAPDGAVVVADEQLAGRGRSGRQWSAPPGTALLMSVILRPEITLENLTRLTMVGAVAVSEALAALPTLPLDLISLKWPNDVQLGGRKVAGILSEAIWHGQSLAAVVVGIGINVRVDFTDTDLSETATSIERVTGSVVNRADLLARVLTRIDHWVARVSEPSLLAAWRGRLNTLGQNVIVQSVQGKEISGQALDVEDDGALILRTAEGQTYRLRAGDVTVLPGD